VVLTAGWGGGEGVVGLVRWAAIFNQSAVKLNWRVCGEAGGNEIEVFSRGVNSDVSGMGRRKG